MLCTNVTMSNSNEPEWMHVYSTHKVTLRIIWPQDFQKFGFCCNFLSKFVYHCFRQDTGTNVSFGFGVIWDCVTAKELAKLNKLANIFWENSTNEATVEGLVLVAGVCCARSCNVITEMPICATWCSCPGAIWPNKLTLVSPPEKVNHFIIFCQFKSH